MFDLHIFYAAAWNCFASKKCCSQFLLECLQVLHKNLHKKFVCFSSTLTYFLITVPIAVLNQWGSQWSQLPQNVHRFLNTNLSINPGKYSTITYAKKTLLRDVFHECTPSSSQIKIPFLKTNFSAQLWWQFKHRREVTKLEIPHSLLAKNVSPQQWLLNRSFEIFETRKWFNYFEIWMNSQGILEAATARAFQTWTQFLRWDHRAMIKCGKESET